MTEFVTLTVNGIPVCVPVGTTIAAAVTAAGVTRFRRSASGEPRAPLCGMGICHECRVTLDGLPHHRSCLLLCADHQEVRTDE
ncbi:MAG: (2Fe-2S)-binding protein [Verrucomicrobia bacterium]|nr:(2Fe-2S)-binding protein [Verrucomicrobiota bacterium]